MTPLIDHAPPQVKHLWTKRIDWRLSAHKFQIPPAGEWRGWMLKAGRGAGKTRNRSAGCRRILRRQSRSEIRDRRTNTGRREAVCFEGDLGVLSILRDLGIDYEWRARSSNANWATGRLWPAIRRRNPTGSEVRSSIGRWCRRLAAWKDAGLGDALNTTFNNLTMGLRLGMMPG